MKAIITPIISLFFFCITNAQVKLPRLISDGMILQRDIKLNIWGWASANEKVTISFKEKNISTTAGTDGKWKIVLPAQKAGGPYSMKITGINEITINDILIGDIWLCSGQSNIEQAMSGRLKYKYADEIASANNNSIRHFLVPDKYDFNQPATDVESGSWKAVTPKNIIDFTAVGYFFAKELYAKYKIPVGLINAALGGSPAEAWISEASLKEFPEYWNEMQQFKDKDFIAKTENKDRNATNEWNKYLNENDEGEKLLWKNSSVNDNEWQQVQVPSYWANTNSGFVNGVIWLRKEINVPASMISKAAKLELGRIVDVDSVFINGKFVGNTTYQYPARRYELNNTVLKEGNNIITVRIVTNSGGGGFVPGKRYELTTATDTIALSGNWKYKIGAKALQPAPATTTVRLKPGGLYNAMIAPLTNYPIKGAIWYQGETNANYPDNYAELMKALIGDWRSSWKQNLPFLLIQLPNYMEVKPVPQLDSKWAVLRQQQLKTMQVANTALAVTIDLGEWNDIHPENKKDVAHRLSLLARRSVYGEKKLIASGPLYHSMKIKGNKIILSFTDIGKGLVVTDGEALKHFAIAGVDGKYVTANAVIKNNTVEVSADGIKNPVAVKYAWADNPEGVNFYNKEGLPASPFEAILKK